MKVALYAFAISALLSERNLNFAAANCGNKCEQSSGSVGQTGIKQHAMMGHSFKNFTVNKPFDCHVKCFDEKCWCQAYQIEGSHCELLEEDRFSSPDDFVEEDGYTYFDMNREFAIQVPEERHCTTQSCSNQCCVQSPCVNGGTCTELCDNAKQKINCTCTAEYFGKLCQKRRATSCKEQTQRYPRSLSGVYQLFDTTTSSLYEEFCDFSSESGFVWSLVESLSLANRVEFKDKAFFKDYPVNQDNFDWNKFRLSKSRMDTRATSSTHFRATCNFNLDGLNYTDYLRARFADIAIMSLMGRQCFKYEYINIRGYDCHNCTADLYQGKLYHAHVDSVIKGCEREFPDAERLPDGEDNFGAYVTINPLHRCSSNNTSTTQWWFGEQY